MAGRKRKGGHREPNGKPQRAEAAARVQAITDVVTGQPHRKWLPEGARLDQRAESAIGRLFLAKLISQPECWAGERFRGILREFHVVLASPMTASAAAIMVSSGVQQDAEGDLMAAERQETDEERRDRVLAAFDKVQRALRGLEDSQVVVRDLDALLLRDLVPDDIGPVKTGLLALAAMWRMEEPAENERDRPVKVRGFTTGELPRWEHEEKIIDIVYR